MNASEIDVLRALIDTVPAPAYACEAPGGAILHANRLAAAMWGRAPRPAERDEELFAARPLSRGDGAVLAWADSPMARALREGVEVDGEEVVIGRPDGSRVQALVHAAPLRDPGGRIRAAISVFPDITERKRAAAAAARLAAIVESSDDAIISKGLDGTIQTWNAAAERIFGYAADEAIGQPVTMLIPPERADEEAEILKWIGRGQRIDHYETTRLRKDGARIDVSLTVSPLRDADGRIVGASKVARDITERKQADRERERLLAREQAARTEAEAANRAKDDFVAMLAHELRNPLGTVLTALRVLEARPPDPGRQQKAIEIATRQARHLARLLDDLLDISRAVRGGLRLRTGPVDLREAVRNVVEANQPLVEARGHSLAVASPEEPLWVEGDPTRLEQVIGNLLNNAVKYTPAGGRIGIRIEREAGLAVLRVRDDGIGIAPELLPHVFDLFTQGETSLARSEGGLGIGLTLVQRLVEAHGGSVEARSEGAGRGSEFVVTLPLMERAASPEQPRVPSLPAGSLRVLLIEDNPDARDVVRTELELLGHTVTMAEDGPEGVAAAARTRPDVVIVDIGLPGFDGYEVARRIRAALGRDVRLIALTGYGQIEHRQRAQAAGFDAYFVKPLRREHLAALGTA